MIDIAKTRIIFVHGLASKPPKEDLFGLWCKAFLSNIKIDRPRLYNAMTANRDLFRFAYWANAVPDHLEDTEDMVKGQRKAVQKLITCRRNQGNNLHISRSGWVSAKVKRFGLNLVDGLGRALTIKDDVIREHMREVRLYHSDQYVADRIRGSVEDELRSAWDEGRHVVLLTHSMGTFVSYDVLWRFSHRSEARYSDYHTKKVAMFVTMGSPLGDAALRDFMLTERWKDADKESDLKLRRRYFPTNIKAWHNYSACGDIVCHSDSLEDVFFSRMRKAVRGFGSDDLRDYVQLYNPFVAPDGTPNPHKSYGYLIQPKLAQRMRRLFGYD